MSLLVFSQSKVRLILEIELTDKIIKLFSKTEKMCLCDN